MGRLLGETERERGLSHYPLEIWAPLSFSLKARSLVEEMKLKSTLNYLSSNFKRKQQVKCNSEGDRKRITTVNQTSLFLISSSFMNYPSLFSSQCNSEISRSTRNSVFLTRGIVIRTRDYSSFLLTTLMYPVSVVPKVEPPLPFAFSIPAFHAASFPS